MSRRVLITGASGFIGSHLARACRDRGDQVVGTRRAGPKVAGVTPARLDLADPAAVRALVREVGPELIFHCGAMARPDDCAADPAACQAVNVEGTGVLVEAAAVRHAQVVFCSTDQLFDGASSWYAEQDPPAPVGIYGRSKLAAERRVLAEPRVRPLAVRTALTYGWARGFGMNFLEGWLRDLRAGRPLASFADQYRTPILVHDLVEALLRLTAGGHQGVFHAGGAQRLSRYEMARGLAETFAIRTELVSPSSMMGQTLADPRPPDVSLNSDKLARTIGFRPRGFVAGLTEMRRSESRREG